MDSLKCFAHPLFWSKLIGSYMLTKWGDKWRWIGNSGSLTDWQKWLSYMTPKFIVYSHFKRVRPLDAVERWKERGEPMVRKYPEEGNGVLLIILKI